jgi:hypothetical protein
MNRALLTMLAFTAGVGVAWFVIYWVDHAYWRLENTRRNADATWRLWWRN